MSNNESNQYRIKRLSLSTIGEMLRERLGSSANSYKFPDDFERAVEDIGFSAAIYDGESSPYDAIFIGEGAVRSHRPRSSTVSNKKFYKSVTFIKTSVIPSWLMAGQTSLTEVNFNEGLTEIGYGAFYGCTALTENIVLPSTVTTLKMKCFYNTRITGFSAEGVTTIDNSDTNYIGTIGNCTNLKTIYLPKVTSLRTGNVRGVFYGDSGLETVQLGSINYPVTELQSPTFQECTSSFTITIYTSSSFADTAVTNVRNYATNATIIIKAASDMTYNGNSYSAGDTMVTSYPVQEQEVE